MISIVMMFFFGWLNTKMKLPDGITYWWFWVNVICVVMFWIAGAFGHKIKLKR